VVGRARLTVAGPLFVEAEASAFAPLVRDRFFVQPNVTIFRAPTAGVAGALGLGLSFW